MASRQEADLRQVDPAERGVPPGKRVVAGPKNFIVNETLRPALIPGRYTAFNTKS